MASWTDGPEYAPHQRPDVFVEPTAWAGDLHASEPASGNGWAGTSAETGQPTAPSYQAPEAPPLDALTPTPPPDRDPTQAFDVATTLMTATAALPPPTGDPLPLAPPPGAATIGTPTPSTTPIASAPTTAPAPLPPSTTSAWGHAHAPQATWAPPTTPPVWSPTQPVATDNTNTPHPAPAPLPTRPAPQVNPEGFPSSAPPPWQQTPTPQHAEPVTAAAMARAATPGVLIALGIGALIGPLSVALLLIASLLANRIRYRRRAIGRLFSAAIGGAFLFGLFGLLGGTRSFSALTWYDASLGWGQVGCAVLFIAIPLTVGNALRRGEAPDDLG